MPATVAVVATSDALGGARVGVEVGAEAGVVGVCRPQAGVFRNVVKFALLEERAAGVSLQRRAGRGLGVRRSVILSCGMVTSAVRLQLRVVGVCVGAVGTGGFVGR